MEANSASLLFLLCVLLALAFHSAECNVTYDRKSLIIHGKRRILLSGSIHYPRSTPQMWESLIQKAKDGGLDVIDTYVFWNVHEPSPGKYDFKGRHDIVRFIKMIQRAGLYVHLRIGPYICSEWNFGGFPVWLKFVPGISFRTDNEPFKAAMQKFTTKIVQMMKDEKLYESQGGPIILSQIENEYEPLRKAFGNAGNAYMTWAAKMAVGQNTGVPWVMCKDADAPDPIINTCNGFYCDYFSPNKPYKPTMWTEAWTGWFTEFGRPIPNRPVQDLAFAVARFIQKGGSFINYYMYHGGTNFGRTSGGPFITTSYDYDAPIDEFGIVRHRKYGHLRELHKAVKLCERALLSADPTVTSLGNYEKAYVFSSKSGGCAAFLSNYNPKSAVRVTFKHRHYNLPPWSISILPDCRKEVFNTAKVSVQKSNMQMVPSNIKLHSWKTFNEDVPSEDHGTDVSAFGLLEQLNMTRDSTDYLWYTTSVDISSSESFLKGGRKPVISVQSAGPAMYLFVDGHLSGSAFGSSEKRRFTFTKSLNLHAGRNRISLLSMSVGLPNIGRNFERWEIGILGPVILYGLDGGKRDISKQKWSYKVGLKGEALNLGSPRSKPSLWRQGSFHAHPLTWYKASFDVSVGDEPLALDMGSMWKGQIWINGHRIGRYWTTRATKNICGRCSYANTYRQDKCQTGCGHVTQKWYHVPRSWLKPAGNQLVVFEEIGGDISKISLVQRRVASVCADVSEDYPNIENAVVEKHNQTEAFNKPELSLDCEAGKLISSIKFASFGTPLGECGSLKYGSCHASDSQDVLEKECVGKQKCSVTLSISRFGTDPCPNVLKKLSVEAVCGTNTTSSDQADSREPGL